MIIKTEDFKPICKTILIAVRDERTALELKTRDDVLYLNINNKAYYLSVNFNVGATEEFRATVNAYKFLNLVSMTTSETIELSLFDTYVRFKGNGTNKLPLVFENDHMLEVSPIVINNETLNTRIADNTLENICNYNNKQLSIGVIQRPVQKMFYFDEQGCITFTQGATITYCNIDTPFKVLLSNDVVNLFKLFKGTEVNFAIGHDPISDTLIQTKVSFKTPAITLVAITGCDDSLLNHVPVEILRNTASKVYPYSVVFSTKELSEALDRLLMCSTIDIKNKDIKLSNPKVFFNFTPEGVTLRDSKDENSEEVKFANTPVNLVDYNMGMDLVYLKKIIDECTEQYITLNCGDQRACIITRSPSISYIVPELKREAD